MSIIDRLLGRKNPSASIAKERLQILVAQERGSRNAPDFLPLMQRELLAVVAKYFEVADDMIKVRVDRAGETSMLEINVELDQAKVKAGTKLSDPHGGERPVGAQPASGKAGSEKAGAGKISGTSKAGSPQAR